MIVWRCRRKIEAFSGQVQWSREITISHLSFFYEGYGEEFFEKGTGNWESHDDLEPNLADISLMLFRFYHFGRNEERVGDHHHYQRHHRPQRHARSTDSAFSTNFTIRFANCGLP